MIPPPPLTLPACSDASMAQPSPVLQTRKRHRTTSSPATLRALIASMTGAGASVKASPRTQAGRVEGSTATPDVENLEAAAAVEQARQRKRLREQRMAASAKLMADAQEELGAAAASPLALRRGVSVNVDAVTFGLAPYPQLSRELLRWLLVNYVIFGLSCARRSCNSGDGWRLGPCEWRPDGVVVHAPTGPHAGAEQQLTGRRHPRKYMGSCRAVKRAWVGEVTESIKQGQREACANC